MPTGLPYGGGMSKTQAPVQAKEIVASSGTDNHAFRVCAELSLDKWISWIEAYRSKPKSVGSVVVQPHYVMIMPMFRSASKAAAVGAAMKAYEELVRRKADSDTIFWDSAGCMIADVAA